MPFHGSENKPRAQVSSDGWHGSGFQRTGKLSCPGESSGNPQNCREHPRMSLCAGEGLFHCTHPRLGLQSRVGMWPSSGRLKLRLSLEVQEWERSENRILAGNHNCYHWKLGGDEGRLVPLGIVGKELPKEVTKRPVT